jgi:hypothetical protein
MRQILPIMICIVMSGCLDLAPKADKLAEINAKLASVEVKLDNKIDLTGNEFTMKLLDYQSKTQQTIGSMSGQLNSGAFSGGAIYVTVVCVTLIVGLIILAGFLYYARHKWKGAFQALKESVHEDAESVDLKQVKRGLEMKMQAKGFKGLIDI